MSANKPFLALCTVETRATCILSHKGEKALVSTVHSGDTSDLPPVARAGKSPPQHSVQWRHGRLTLCCTSVKKHSSALCTVETLATYPLLHNLYKREKALVSTVYGETRATYILLHEGEKALVSTVHGRDAGRLTICWKTLEKPSSAVRGQWRCSLATSSNPLSLRRSTASSFPTTLATSSAVPYLPPNHDLGVHSVTMPAESPTRIEYWDFCIPASPVATQ
jgi:hypothetical protein